MVDVVIANTYATMKALAPAAGNAVFVADPLRGGHFVCKAGSKPTDPQEGIYVASNTAGFYYERDRESDMGRPEWFGAVPNSEASAATNRTAMQACLALVQTTLLDAVDYYIDATLVFDRSGCVFQGVAGSGRSRGLGVSDPMGTPGGSRVILTGNAVVTGTVFQFGKTTPSTHDDSNLARNSYVRNILFTRKCTPALRPNPSSNDNPVNCVKGVIMSGASRCGMENVSSFDNPVGFHYYGVVASYSRDCDAARTTPANNPTNDYFVGHIAGGYDVYYNYAGSNASLYLQHPTCYDDQIYTPGVSWGNPLFALSIGIKLFGLVADTFIDDAEVGRVDIGIEIDGRNAAGSTIPLSVGPGGHQNVRLTNCVIDQSRITGLQIRNLNASGQLAIDDLYAAGAHDSSHAINIFAVDQGASIDFTAGRLLGPHDAKCKGFAIDGVSNVSIRGTYIRDFNSPVVLNNVSSSLIEPKIFNSPTRSTTAIVATGCHRNSYRPQINGTGGAFAFGVEISDPSYCNGVDGSAINPGCFTVVDAARKVRYGGTDARSGGFAGAANVLIGATA